MVTEEKNRRILLLSDGKKGHLHQSQGAVHRIPNARILTVEISRSFPRHLLLTALALLSGLVRPPRRVLCAALSRSVREGLGKIERFGPDMIISAGSLTHPVNLLLGILTGAKTVICMRPSVLPARRFDLAIVPRHDMEKCRGDNVVYTLGAPSALSEAHIFSEAVALKARAPKSSGRCIGLLVGGDSANNYIDARTAETIRDAALDFCRERGFNLFAATSRRTPREVEDVFAVLRGEPDLCPYLLLASESPENPTPGIIGLCEAVVVTEDSVSMVSEVLAGGKHVVAVRVGRKKDRWKFDFFFQDLAREGYVTLAEPGGLHQALRDVLEKGKIINRPLDESGKVAEEIERKIFGTV